jgi:hypothetical protein
MIQFFDILSIYGINPSFVKLVRHGNKELNIRETFYSISLVSDSNSKRIQIDEKSSLLGNNPRSNFYLKATSPQA